MTSSDVDKRRVTSIDVDCVNFTMKKKQYKTLNHVKPLQITSIDVICAGLLVVGVVVFVAVVVVIVCPRQQQQQQDSAATIKTQPT